MMFEACLRGDWENGVTFERVFWYKVDSMQRLTAFMLSQFPVPVEEVGKTKRKLFQISSYSESHIKNKKSELN